MECLYMNNKIQWEVENKFHEKLKKNKKPLAKESNKWNQTIKEALQQIPSKYKGIG